MARQSLFEDVGLDGEAYCTHSMRRGGATELYARGVAIEIIMEQGRWKCAKTMRHYVDWNVGIARRLHLLQGGSGGERQVGTKEGGGGLRDGNEADSEADAEETQEALVKQAIAFLEQWEDTEVE